MSLLKNDRTLAVHEEDREGPMQKAFPVHLELLAGADAAVASINEYNLFGPNHDANRITPSRRGHPVDYGKRPWP